MENIQHVNIIFATPANSFTPSYLKSLLMTITELEKEGISWGFVSEGGSLVAMARETTMLGPEHVNNLGAVPWGGQFTYDTIMWIDSDISWEPIDVFKLYKSDKEIISGCYLMPDRNIPIYNMPRGDMMPEELLYEYKKPFQIAGCGFGFLAVKSGVFEKMPRPWFGPESVPDGNNGEVFVLIGEDLSWCTKAIKKGFEIWVDPTVRVTHEKPSTLDWKNR